MGIVTKVYLLEENITKFRFKSLETIFLTPGINHV